MLRLTSLNQVLVVVILLLYCFDIYFHLLNPHFPGSLKVIFNIASESSIFSWLTNLLWAWTVLHSWQLYSSSRFDKIKSLYIALLFSYFALDDGVRLHERISPLLDNFFGSTFSFFPSYSWLIILLPFFAILVFILTFILLHALEDTLQKKLLKLSVVMCVVAVGLDFIDGLPLAHPLNLYVWLDSLHSFQPLIFELTGDRSLEAIIHVSRMIEETLELAAIAIWLQAIRCIWEQSYANKL